MILLWLTRQYEHKIPCGHHVAIIALIFQMNWTYSYVNSRHEYQIPRGLSAIAIRLKDSMDSVTFYVL